MDYRKIMGAGIAISVIGIGSIFLVQGTSVSMLIGTLLGLIGIVTYFVGALPARPSETEKALDREMVKKAFFT